MKPIEKARLLGFCFWIVACMFIVIAVKISDSSDTLTLELAFITAAVIVALVWSIEYLLLDIQAKRDLLAEKYSELKSKAWIQFSDVPDGLIVQARYAEVRPIFLVGRQVVHKIATGTGIEVKLLGKDNVTLAFLYFEVKPGYTFIQIVKPTKSDADWQFVLEEA